MTSIRLSRSVQMSVLLHRCLPIVLTSVQRRIKSPAPSFPTRFFRRHGQQIGSRKLSPKIPRPTPRKDTAFKRHTQSGIARTKLVKSTDKERKKSKKLGVSSQNKHRARSQSVGALNQTPLNKRRRSRSKSARAKVQGMRDAGKDLGPRP